MTGFSLWMQPEPTQAVQQAAPSSEAPGAPQRPPDSGSSMLIMFALMFVVFYFLLIRPQQKRQKETDSMLKALRKGDKVRTSGGIRGEIMELSDDDVTLLIAEKVKINVLRSHVSARLDKPSDTEAKK
jgi:preprotein translocase subunit YajC